MSKILFATSELHPLIKTGGLADVSGSLPIALKDLKHSVRVIMPAYADILPQLKNSKSVAKLNLTGIPGKVEILQCNLPGTGIKGYFVAYDAAFNRPGNPYLADDGTPWPDNAERFSLFAKAVVQIALNKAELKWQPDVIHCNDWQTGLIPALLSLHKTRPATLFTIHNLAYQGLFPYETFSALGLPPELWSHEALEFHDQLSFIKGGLACADAISTVSPQYATEIRTNEFGYGLEGLLDYRKNDLHGIINGIDNTVWDPSTDCHIDYNYNSENFNNKQKNKIALLEEFGLAEKKDTLLIGSIGRLVEQKGIDLVIDALPDLIKKPVQFVLLGSGEKNFETALKQWQQKAPHKISVKIGYNEVLAHKIEAGADCFLMPSRFEPCGLNQLYSLRYGTLPIVRKTGGLADSVVDITPSTLSKRTATGFVFKNPESGELMNAISGAVKLYQSRDKWNAVAATGMQQDFSWEQSAKKYLKIYRKIILNQAWRL